MNKYEWLEVVMASKIKHAAKTFAFGLYKHMDRQGTCYPGDKALMEATGMSRGHFSEYRRILITSGMINVEVRKTQNGDSYTYSIPENAPDGGVLDEENATNGNEKATDGEQNATSGDEKAANGGMNTVYNTTKNTVDNTFKTTDASAGSCEESKVREDSQPSPNYKDVPPDLPNAGSRDAAQVAEIVRTSRGWRLGHVTYLSEFDAEAARQRLKEREKAS